MGKRQVELRGVVEGKEEGLRWKIRAKKTRTLSQDGSRRRARRRMRDEQVGNLGGEVE